MARWLISQSNLPLMRKAAVIQLLFMALTSFLYGQDSSRLTFSAYGELYYNIDFSKPPTHTRPPFVYSHNRTGEFNLNLGLIRVGFSSEQARAYLGLMAGTYPNANLAAEPGVLKNVYEAHAGVRIGKQHKLWLDAGILPSHIGWEHAIGKDNWTLTRSMAADNSPYYEAGARLSYTTKDQKWYAALLLLNGWQRIQRIEGNHTPGFGTQLTFIPSHNVLINSSTFIGSDQPDSARKMRYFHNLYGTIRLSNNTGITLGIDVGLEQKQKASKSTNVWYTSVIILRFLMERNKSIALRGEYYKDKFGVIIHRINGFSFRTWSGSFNLDWSLTQNILWRSEIKLMNSKHPVFLQKDGTYSEHNFNAATALCFYF